MVEGVAVPPALDVVEDGSADDLDRGVQQDRRDEPLGVEDDKVARVAKVGVAIAVDVDELRRYQPIEQFAGASSQGLNKNGLKNSITCEKMPMIPKNIMKIVPPNQASSETGRRTRLSTW